MTTANGVVGTGSSMMPSLEAEAGKQPLRALIAFESETDFARVVRTLNNGGYEVDARRIETAETLQAALASETWDIMFSDWSLSRFSATAAMAILRNATLDLPFIIVSGTAGEEVAVEAIRNGAHDFLVKTRLDRLPRAVERELREAQLRRERTEMREQLMISDRMVAVGILAAGVAHEINNPLAVVVANLDFAATDVAALIHKLGESSLVVGLREELSDACAAADRVRTIVRDIKVFSRSEPETLAPVDVQRVLESSLRMASNEIRHRAKVVTDYGSLRPVLASEARLGQVFLNLIVNAAQAIPEGTADQNQIRIRTHTDGAWARIDIEDTGQGIPPEIMSRLFKPFVTTKPIGVGTGLGLSICHRIITEFHGDISVDSQPGMGTVFTVRLPFADAPMVTREIPKVGAGKATRRGSILVIDDEPLVAAALCRCLAAEHAVTCLVRGREAIERIRQGERFDVIVSDLMMPEITGMQVHAELAAIAPEQAAAMVFLTGGAFTRRSREFLETVANQCLEKPFDPGELRAVVNDLVG